MIHFRFRFMVFYIVGILTFCESKVIINFRLYNYLNPDDIMHNGYKCESFHWMNDYCDPMFHVCVTSRYRCDVLNLYIDHWKNKKYVYNIISRTIKLNDMPKSLVVEVRIEDHDRFDAHDHIAVFHSIFHTSTYNQNYGNQMTVSPSGLNVHLYSSVSIQCEDNYYGIECETFCKSKSFNYDCNKMTGKRICLVNCGDHGFCSWNISSEEFICSCKSGWTGGRCQFIHYDQCSKISCKKTCVKDEENIHCVCSYNIYIETCTERLPLSTTPVTTTMDTTIVTTTKQLIEIKAIYLKPFQTTNIIVKNGYVDTIKETLDQTSQQLMTQASIKNEKEAAKQQSNHIMQSTHSPTTIVIICLLILLCICILALVFVIRKLGKKEVRNQNRFTPSPFLQRPLPSIVFRPNVNNIKRTSSVFSNSTLPDLPQYNYDSFTIQTDYNYETSLISLPKKECKDNDELYEVPINTNTDNFTIQTELQCNINNENEFYEEPTKV